MTKTFSVSPYGTFNHIFQTEGHSVNTLMHYLSIQKGENWDELLVTTLDQGDVMTVHRLQSIAPPHYVVKI